MKALRSAGLFLLLLVLTVCPSVPEGTELPVSDSYALDYFKDNKLTAGWNLGNSLDAGNETAWNNPKINQELLNGVKAQGFNLIRIPVTWKDYIGGAPGYTIKADRLARVREVADMAHNAELVVIINLHHDGSTDSATSESGWLSINKSLASASDKAAITAKYKSVWTQIAQYFKDYDEWLIFEGFNELHDGKWFWAERVNQVPQAQYDLVNEWAQIFTDTVRAAGGKNAARMLMIPSYCTGAEALLSNKFKLPNDSAAGRLIVTFHYYRPDAFGLNASTPNWGTSAEKSAIDRAFSPFKEAFIDRNIPVVLGECGAPATNASDKKTAHASRVAYLSHVFGTAKKYGIVPVYWDNGVVSGGGEKFGVFNRNTGQPFGYPTVSDYKQYIDAMINAVK